MNFDTIDKQLVPSEVTTNLFNTYRDDHVLYATNRIMYLERQPGELI